MITGEARHRVKWRPLTEDEEAAALAELRTLAGPPLGCAGWPGRRRRHTGLDRVGPPPLGELQRSRSLRSPAFTRHAKALSAHR
jgi:hypothetical protein